MAPTGMLDLEQDPLLLICTLLPIRDLCAFSQACRRTRDAVREEQVWHAACRSMVHSTPAYRLLRAESMPSVMAWMQASSFRTVFKALYKLGCWPEGVWRANRAAMMPRGQLVHVTCGPGARFMLRTLCNEREQVHTFQLQDRGRACPTFSMRGGERALMLCGRHRTADGTLVLALCYEAAQLSVLAGVAQAVNIAMGAQPGSRAGQTYELCCSLPLPPWPTSLPDQSANAGCALHRLQGVWKARYGGPHGTEYIRICMAGAGSAPPPGCPVTSERLQGFKITGDPNVPSGQYSFVVPCSDPVLSRIDMPNGMEGPIVVDGMLQNENFLSRPVAARFPGFAQINYDPGAWAPQWIRIQLLAYEGTRPLFSILWSYPRSGFRELMDFSPLPFAARAPLAELGF